MKFRAAATLAGVLALGLMISVRAPAQRAGPPPGYYDIPPGYDFPADKQRLDQYRQTGNLSAERLHAWHVFAGMTQPTPDGQHPIFTTWYSEDETFQAGPAPQGLIPRRVTFPFRVPAQFRESGLAPQAAGTALLSFVLYNYPAYYHIRSNRLYLTTTLDSLRQSGAADRVIPADRTVPPFPADAIALKTIWWPVAKDKITPMPVWDPDLNPARPAGNPFTTWARTVAIDPTRTNIPPDATTDILFNGHLFPKSHVVGLNSFYYIVLDQQTVSAAMQNPVLAQGVQIALGRPLQAGDYAVFLGTHVTTKEIDDWVWATFWWHDRPDAGQFATDRPADVSGVWRNYLMSVSYDLNLPRESDGTAHVAFNPWLEGRFRNGGNGGGVVSNCMNCHNRASDPDLNFLPVYRGDPDPADAAYAAGRLRTDFLWSIPDQQQPQP
jgi:hypothetical protein